ncbi:IclR family transcriptional regulator [Ignatzschineria cameli]|uniref:helix-turn-helix domain-containing protein n=1 Tax=Ignatzschineria cameli TaxID=2182793 RepID=UPI000D603D4B|nr:helix-turn-helix domain-containing protein [Ignatzschineria cameli]PWD89576.1 IclR family transcriptional regulator [Ignatzschineria cameli]
MTISKSQLRPLLIIEALKGRSFTGMSNSEIASVIGEDRSQVARSLHVLIHAGFVEQLPNELYALSTKILNIATSHAREVQAINQKLAEINS